MMNRSQSYSFRDIISIYFLFFFFISLLNTFASPTRPLCRHDQRDALLELGKEFPIHSNNKKHVTTVPWNKSVDCCFWEGVMCDGILGEVIFLNLTSRIANIALKPSFGLFKLKYLRKLDLSGCNLQGEIPSSIGNLSHLTDLDLSYNQFEGLIPESISNLLDLNVLDLSHNNFGGRVSTSISKLVNLTYLDLSYNKLKGQIPQFIFTSSTLDYVQLSHNSFTSFGKSMKLGDNKPILLELDLSSNSLQGPIPQWICNLRYFFFLDLANNHLTGSIPQCLMDSTYFDTLNLRNNSLSGFLPDLFTNACSLRSLDVSRNNLVGKLPKSLTNCSGMEFLNVKGNKIMDTFPFWLGSLQFLRVLVLRSNAFYGPVYNSSAYLGFPSLRIIDISDNNFVGSLPHDYFANWTEMSLVGWQIHEIVVKSFPVIIIPELNYLGRNIHQDSIDLVYKGVDTNLVPIFQGFKVIDFSGNRFHGHIPESIGLLSELRLLNLSGNAFTGNIPPSLANISKLETLDLSRNNLSGEIPQSLGKLSFLSNVNVSHNHLEGLVPQSTQFRSQNCSSFVGNTRLYGLKEICRKNHYVPVSTLRQPEDYLSKPEEPALNWIAVAIAFGPGVFFGLVIGHIFTSYRNEWFIAR